jgi:endonuclease/exonuclease/phosphatase family metal-dependent hydrolase
MAISFRKFSKRIFIALNFLASVVFCATCLQPWHNANTFWFLGFFSLSFPYLFIILLLFIFFWLAADIKYSLISIVAMLIAWKQIDVLFNVKQSSFSLSRQAGNLRVMSWNVQSFYGLEKNADMQRRNAEKILKLIEEVNPDVLCLQEFGQYDSSNKGPNYSQQLKALGYEHFTLSRDYTHNNRGYSNGVAIFSKYPLITSKRIPYPSGVESVLYADILFNGDTIRVFTTHLQSFKFSGSDYRDIEKIKNNDDSLYEASLNIYAKMKRAFVNRAQQADMLQPLLDESPYPEILACDMNDVPTSYAYWQLKGERYDAFAEKGFGVGRTFIALAPTLRIDYILPDKRFGVTQFNVIQKRYSDHFPIVSDLQLRNSIPAEN